VGKKRKPIRRKWPERGKGGQEDLRVAASKKNPERDTKESA